MLERLFRLRENGTTVRTEILAGVTTFLTMAYIIAVNPLILKDAGMDPQAVLLATCVASAVASLVMGLWANYPFALAPGMGLNAYFTYGVVLGMGYTWQAALGAVFISGVVFILLSLSGVREKLIDAVPLVIRRATSAGIGLFIAFIGLKNAGLIQASDATFITLGSLNSPSAVLAIGGLLFTLFLMIRRVPGAMLLGIVASSAVAYAIGLTEAPAALTGLHITTPAIGQLDIRAALSAGALAIIFAFLFVDMFDSIGTFIGVAERAGFLDKQGRLPRGSRALLADAVGTVVGSLLGTSTVTTYVESSSGVAAGGRTGLTSVVVAVLFLLALLAAPLVAVIPAAATAPALVIVGILMMSPLRQINWEDLTEAIPAFFTVAAMPFTFSIANGIAFGFITYAVAKLAARDWKALHPAVAVLAVLFVARFAFLAG